MTPYSTANIPGLWVIRIAPYPAAATIKLHNRLMRTPSHRVLHTTIIKADVFSSWWLEKTLQIPFTLCFRFFFKAQEDLSGPITLSHFLFICRRPTYPHFGHSKTNKQTNKQTNKTKQNTNAVLVVVLSSSSRWKRALSYQNTLLISCFTLIERNKRKK